MINSSNNSPRLSLQERHRQPKPPKQSPKHTFWVMLKQSQKMRVSWTQRDDEYGPVGIVIGFDGHDKLLFRFEKEGKVEPSRCQKAFGLCSAVANKTLPGPLRNKTIEVMIPYQGKVNLGFYNEDRSTILGTFMEISIVTKEEKDYAMGIFRMINKIRMGDFVLMKNNCRHFVEKVALMLWNLDRAEFTEEEWNNFQRDIEQIKRNDLETYKNYPANVLEMEKKNSQNTRYLEDQYIANPSGDSSARSVSFNH